MINSGFYDYHASVSKNGLSLYISSDRPGGVNGKNSTGLFEIWVSQRASLDADWGPPVNLDATVKATEAPQALELASATAAEARSQPAIVVVAEATAAAPANAPFIAIATR